MISNKKLKQYYENLEDERNGAALYHAISQLEKNPHLKEVYRRLSEAEQKHSRFWEHKIKSTGNKIPHTHINWRTRTLIFLAKRFGPRFVLPNIVSLEHIDSHKYDTQPEAGHEGLPQQEQSHARLLKAISSEDFSPGIKIAQLEGRHRAIGGNALRAAVLGANDGLLSNFSLVMGVSGAHLAPRSVLITGIAGLLAGACSMALGEWLSVQSARELYQRQLEVERQEVEEIPEEEADELKLIYQAKGLSEQDAAKLARRIISDPSQALNTLAREELGINPQELGGSPWIAAITSFALFAVGAVVPVLPFWFFSGDTSVMVSVILCAMSLFGLGAGITLLTGRSAVYSGFRQVLFGFLAAAVTYSLGWLFKTSL
jgi:VIT1/CCC1 family predicted Fe2+/Mn2+ transporter